jgi:t-SNARE complex subunit (syntaxin)
MEEIIRQRDEKQKALSEFEDRHKEILTQHRIMVYELMDITNACNKELLKNTKQ